MQFLKHASIKSKLVWLTVLTSGLALVLAFSAIIYYESTVSRERLKRELTNLANITGQIIVTALEFDDAALAREILQTLDVDPYILEAAVYDQTGKLFVSHQRKGLEKSFLPSRPREDGVYIGNFNLTLFKPVKFKNKRIGTIFIRADLSELQDRIIQYALISGIVLLISFLLAFLLSQYLQKMISGPVQKLQEAAAALGEGRIGYEIKIDSRDEIGALADSFNHMSRNLKKTTVSRDYVDSIIRNMRGALIVLTPKSIIERVNRATLDLLGYEEEEIVGQPLATILESKGSKDGELFMDIIKKGIIQNVENVFLTKDGRKIPVLFSASVLMDEKKTIRGAVCVASDISERISAEEEIILAKEEAENANRAKSEFLARMSHELRTPLNAILGFSQLLAIAPNAQIAPEQKDHVNHILKAGEHLLELINEVLDLARIESGQIKQTIDLVDINSLTMELVALWKPMENKYKVKLDYKADETIGIHVLADKVRLNQALHNLISNAFKYNREHGTVSLSYEEIPGGLLRFNVTDTGLGIPLEKQELLYEPFNRLGAEYSDIDGTGIGLTITRRLVELMNGNLGMESAVGKGSCFFIELPIGLRSASKGAEEKIPIKVEPGAEKEEGDRAFNILYVEDNPDNRALFKQIFAARSDINLLTATHAQQGIDIALAQLPDLILLDIHLPGMDGITALKKLKSYEETKNIPVVAISADAMPGEIEKAMAAGFDHYITKPVKIPFLLKMIEKMIGKTPVG